MKNLKLILIGLLFSLSASVNAQVTVNVNLGTQPQWGPVGYTQVRYYYLPDVQAYYDISTKKFIYLDHGNWIHRTYLPSRYSGYDLYGGHKVVLKSYRGNTPFIYYDQHKEKYVKGYKGGGPQKTIGQKPGHGNSKQAPPSQHKSSPAQNHTNPSHQQSNPGKGSSNKGGQGKGGKGHK